MATFSAVALVRFGGLRFFHAHGGRGAGFIWLMLGIAFVGLILWALARSGKRAA